MPVLTYFHIGENGTYVGAGFDYEYRLEDGKGVISIRIDGVRSEDALILNADEQFVSKLESIIEEHKLRKWDGFSKSDNNVLDGSGFGFYVRYDDRSRISASGYMMYPKGYDKAVGAFDSLFLPLYEAVRPNRIKVMNRYFEEVILKERPRLEKQEIGMPYISDGGDMYRVGVCKCTGGAAAFPVYNGENDPSYMLVITLDKADSKWILGCEAYKLTDKGEVLPWGSVEIDPNFFSCERLYGHIFTRWNNGILMLGCFTQKGFSASGRDSLYYIDLYDIENKLEPLANEKAEGPPYNKEWWTPDKIQNFINVADRYGFTQSKAHWEKMPNDPVFASGMDDNANHRFDFLMSNNHDKNFYSTLINTPKGEPVGEYRIKGTLYLH